MSVVCTQVLEIVELVKSPLNEYRDDQDEHGGCEEEIRDLFELPVFKHTHSPIFGLNVSVGYATLAPQAG